MIVFFPYYEFIIYRVFLQCFHVSILSWRRNTSSPLAERGDDPEVLPKVNHRGLETYLTSPASFPDIVFKIHLKITVCSMSFGFRFKDNIVNDLSKMNFLKILLFIVFPPGRTVYPWGALKPV